MADGLEFLAFECKVDGSGDYFSHDCDRNRDECLNDYDKALTVVEEAKTEEAAILDEEEAQ